MDALEIMARDSDAEQVARGLTAQAIALAEFIDSQLSDVSYSLAQDKSNVDRVRRALTTSVNRGVNALSATINPVIDTLSASVASQLSEQSVIINQLPFQTGGSQCPTGTVAVPYLDRDGNQQITCIGSEGPGGTVTEPIQAPIITTGPTIGRNEYHTQDPCTGQLLVYQDLPPVLGTPRNDEWEGERGSDNGIDFFLSPSALQTGPSALGAPGTVYIFLHQGIPYYGIWSRSAIGRDSPSPESFITPATTDCTPQVPTSTVPSETTPTPEMNDRCCAPETVTFPCQGYQIPGATVVQVTSIDAVPGMGGDIYSHCGTMAQRQLLSQVLPAGFLYSLLQLPRGIESLKFEATDSVLLELKRIRKSVPLGQRASALLSLIQRQSQPNLGQTRDIREVG